MILILILIGGHRTRLYHRVVHWGPINAVVHSFGEFELDETLFQLRRAGNLVKVEPKVFDVLLYLLQHRDRVVPKDELLEALWQGSVSDSVLPRCITAARRALADDGTRQEIIETIRRRGYRFVAAVTSPVGTMPGLAPPQTPSAGQSEPAPAAQTSSAPVPSGTTPGIFVGRTQTLGRLTDALDAALSGRGRLIMLVGEPGIGKTRTAAEVCHTARQRGATVLTGRSFEGEGAPAFWPWVQILRRAIEVEVIDPHALGLHTAELAALVPEIRDRVPNVPEPPGVTADQARFRQFDAVATVLCTAARRHPLVIVLEDLHWADTPSLRLLQFLAGVMGETRMLLVATYRDVTLPRTAPLARVLG
ncbi:MAG: AAA family ATPase, partial [Nannocystaceae bacterium]|nr:AAA family ATPase [Nannocystaceae bacterium]